MTEEIRPQGESPNAQTLKARFAWLNHFADNEIDQVAMASPGYTLKTGEEYFDISHPESGVQIAKSELTVGPDDTFIASKTVSPTLWAKITDLSLKRPIGDWQDQSQQGQQFH